MKWYKILLEANDNQSRIKSFLKHDKASKDEINKLAIKVKLKSQELADHLSASTNKDVNKFIRQIFDKHNKWLSVESIEDKSINVIINNNYIESVPKEFISEIKGN